MRGELGHERVTVCAGDLGGVVAQDLSLRFDGLVERLLLFNTIPPLLPDGPREVPRAARMAADYFLRHARTPTAWRPSSTPPSGAAATWRSSTARASGPRRAPSPARTWTS